MNIGHDGSLSTGHANSAIDMLSRLETMVLMGMDLPVSAIRRQIASGIDIIVHLGRLRDRTRRVLEIAEVIGMEQEDIQIETLCLFEEEDCDLEEVKGRLVFKKEVQNKRKLRAAGLPDLPLF